MDALCDLAKVDTIVWAYPSPKMQPLPKRSGTLGPRDRKGAGPRRNMLTMKVRFPDRET